MLFNTLQKSVELPLCTIILILSFRCDIFFFCLHDLYCLHIAVRLALSSSDVSLSPAFTANDRKRRHSASYQRGAMPRERRVPRVTRNALSAAWVINSFTAVAIWLVSFSSDRASFIFVKYILEISSFRIVLKLSRSGVDQHYPFWGFQSEATTWSWRVPLHFIMKITGKWSDSGSLSWISKCVIWSNSFGVAIT